VGKEIKQGNLLCSTSTRGHLSLTLLPSSDLRLSFVGDDGVLERLAVLSPDNENSSVVIEGISSDTSGRSFLLRLPGGKLLYFRNVSRVNSTEAVSGPTNLNNMSAPSARPSQCFRLGLSQPTTHGYPQQHFYHWLSKIFYSANIKQLENYSNNATNSWSYY
jgi:hypothetical protein